jgi:hypothetical protein
LNGRPVAPASSCFQDCDNDQQHEPYRNNEADNEQHAHPAIDIGGRHEAKQVERISASDQEQDQQEALEAQPRAAPVELPDARQVLALRQFLVAGARIVRKDAVPPVLDAERDEIWLTRNVSLRTFGFASNRILPKKNAA